MNIVTSSNYKVTVNQFKLETHYIELIILAQILEIFLKVAKLSVDRIEKENIENISMGKNIGKY